MAPMNTTTLLRGAAATGVVVFSAAALAQYATVPSVSTAGGSASAPRSGSPLQAGPAANPASAASAARRLR